MTLYIIPVPAPNPGEDWSYTVPGEYLEHITGVTATLSTFLATATAAVDSSPNGNTGTYNNPDITFGVPGLVAGDVAVTVDKTAPTYGVDAPVSTGWIPATDMWMNFWGDLSPGTVTRSALSFDIAPERLFFEVFESVVPGTWVMAFGWGAADPTSQKHIFLPVTAGPHMFSVTFKRGTGAGGTVRFYVDGVPHAPNTGTGQDGPSFDATAASFCLSPNGPDTYDEIAFGTGLPSDADLAALYAAASSSFAAYSAAQLALGTTCEGYYHLDDLLPGTGRQVAFDVTDGTNLVDEIPTGFAEAAGNGQYFYSWQPNLNSSSQTPGGAVTTVAIPDLILPAGYTVGTRTFDLGTADQWSDIFVWWDSGYMDALDPLNAYVFPGGIRLVYQQERP